MAKQDSPVRINPTLLSQAQAAAETFNRKVTDQLSYWANIGRLVESKLNGNELSALFSGIGDIQVIVGHHVDSHDSAVDESSFSVVDLALSNQTPDSFGQTTAFISKKSTGVRYEVDPSRAGLLRRVAQDGSFEVGTFKNGVFRKSAKAKVAVDA